MASKSSKLRGVPRIASNRQDWYGFTLQRGFVYLDDGENLYASSCVPAEKYGCANPKKGYFIAFRKINTKTDLFHPTLQSRTIYGSKCRSVNPVRPVVVRVSGIYGDGAWNAGWQIVQLPMTAQAAIENKECDIARARAGVKMYRAWYENRYKNCGERTFFLK